MQWLLSAAQETHAGATNDEGHTDHLSKEQTKTPPGDAMIAS